MLVVKQNIAETIQVIYVRSKVGQLIDRNDCQLINKLQVCQVTMPVLTLARYILETSLMEYKFNVQLSESLLAAATLSLAMKVS